jgi:hypothetical protein
MSDGGRTRGHRDAHRRADDDRAGEQEPPRSAALLALQQGAGNRAVANLVVQRYAFVRDKQVNPSHPSLTPAMKAMAADTAVRDYRDGGEFADHAGGKTDHVGTLRAGSPGTWVRFPRTGSNLLGEDHTKVTLEHVVRAVGSTNFIYEPLATDDMSAQPSMKAAYEQENAARLTRMGVGGAADTRKLGAESLFPKIGFAMAALLPELQGGLPFDGLKAAAYFGQPAQRYLKIAWGYGKDVAGEIAGLKAAKRPVPSELTRLAATVKRLTPALDAFITGLPAEGFLGDALDTTAGRKHVPDLVRFCTDAMNAMTARIATDAVLTEAERKTLQAMPRATTAQKVALFSVWRDMEFAHAVRAAVARGVRYAGMGLLHLNALQAEGLPKGSHGFDMVGLDLATFKTQTDTLAGKAKPSP